MLCWKQPQGMEVARLHQKLPGLETSASSRCLEGIWKELGDLLAPCGKINLTAPLLPAAAWIP